MFHIYVDGSCLGNQNVDEETPAGWGVVVITGSNDLGRGNGEIFHEFNGRVITDPDESRFIGAEVGSNNTAELTAFAEALRWVLSEGGDSEIIIKTDSQYAGNQATGNWKAKANRELVAHVQALWNEVSQLRDLSWDHVKAHSGHRWNERADHLAIRAANNEVPVSLSFWKPGQR
ncbi:MAG: RNase H family protein [Candidatus Thermoplasmatota archaeon]|nr:RNase H family protein [Candidatus Thermoplasmatota archaeon]